MRLWVISDTHFGHANIVHKFEPPRPFATIHEHDETIIRNWNARVRPEDHVYHLGDFAMNRRYLPIATRLLGHKRLVRGNHDIFKTQEYIDVGFEEIYGVRVFRPQDQQGKTGFILSHIPLHPTSVQRWARNVHGHLHFNRVLDENGHPDQRYICVSVEHTGYAPVLLADL